MILNNLIKKLIDLLGGYSDKKVYIELLKHDKENDTDKYYRINITEVSEGGSPLNEEYTTIVGHIDSCVEIESDYKLTKRKIIIHD
tara:strand:- start:690 stop:947 length:258 start_codon:yes stop_codon:yes gene_type:complete